jgi:1-aminocyclopropane-1-carboxylate deaminase/D-cysteine desulfhydrase-like pyridoxal-dependent ACC family enzyme
MAWVVVVVALGTASTALLLVLVVALLRHVKVLSAALKSFQEQLRPVVEDVRRSSMRASDRLQGLSNRRLRR